MSDRKGEGSYDGTEQFQKDQHKFAKEGPVKEKAREAAEALDGDEAEELEKARKDGPIRDAERYYFTVFGTPHAQGQWGWSVEGHHLSLNFAVSDGNVVFAGNGPRLLERGIPYLGSRRRRERGEEKEGERRGDIRTADPI